MNRRIDSDLVLFFVLFFIIIVPIMAIITVFNLPNQVKNKRFSGRMGWIANLRKILKNSKST
ncbi:MAG: hypothetical protein ACFFCI_02240 [Promethearchaeota archaeon]